MASNQNLTIDDITRLAIFKTGNFNISAQEAVQELNKVAPNATHGFDAQSVNGWGVQTGYKWAGNVPTQISTGNEPDKIASKLYNVAEKYYGAVNEKEFQAELNRLNQTNAMAVWKQYNKISPDETLIEMICDEKVNSANDRKNAVQKVFNALVAEAKSKGVDTSHFESEFRADLNYQFRKIGTTDTEKLDKITNALIFAADNKASLTPEQKTAIKNTPVATQHANTNTMISNRLSSSKTNFNNQLKQDGWAADVADFVSKGWGSDNTADKVRGDLAKADLQLKQLQAAQKNNKYDVEFYKTFGLEYDAENIQAYQNKETIYKNAALNKGVEDAYNHTLQKLLASPKLYEETMYIQTSSFGTGQYVVTADKWDVYNREVNNLKKFLGDKASDVLMIELRKAHLENASLDAKYAFLHDKAKSISNKLHANTVEAGGGKEFSEVEKDYEYSYNAAFGVKNDIMKRVNDYNISQQVGGGVVKMATISAVAIGASFFTGGSSLSLLTVAGVTAGTSFTVEVSDRFSSGQVVDAFKEGGFTAGMKKGAEVTDWGETLKNAAISGGTVLIGGGIAKGVQFVSSGLTPVKQAGIMFGTDVAFGAGVEKVMTGEITVQGMVFTVALSAAGNIIAIKQANKPNNVNKNQPPTSPSSEIGGLSNTGKPQLKINSLGETTRPRPTAETPKVTTPEPAIVAVKTLAVKDLGLPKPTAEAVANAAVKPTNAHLNTKGMEFFNALSAEEKAIVKLHGIDEDNVMAIHGILRKRLTSVDTPDVIEARYIDAKKGSLDPNTLTADEKSFARRPFLEKMANTPQEKKLVIVTGRGGSGKSTIVEKLLKLDKDHLLLDSDEIKKLLPGYNNGQGANYVHEASTALNNDLFNLALENGTNIVMPTTGYPDYLNKLIQQAHAKGYNIEIIHSDIKMETSMSRAVERYVKGELQADGINTHRFVDPAYIERGAYVDQVITNFKDNPFVREIILYDNNGTYPPKFVEKVKK